MPLRDQLALLMRALADDDPAAVLAKEDPALLERIDRDGLELTVLLVRKLRFERILSGDESAREEFQRDPEGFTQRFREYHRAVPPVHLFPRLEARAFREFLTRRGSRP